MGRPRFALHLNAAPTVKTEIAPRMSPPPWRGSPFPTSLIHSPLIKKQESAPVLIIWIKHVDSGADRCTLAPPSGRIWLISYSLFKKRSYRRWEILSGDLQLFTSKIDSIERKLTVFVEKNANERYYSIKIIPKRLYHRGRALTDLARKTFQFIDIRDLNFSRRTCDPPVVLNL